MQFPFKPNRLLHVMLRVSNLEASVNFYTSALGMVEKRRRDYPDGRFTLVFLGYGDESEATVIELTHNWDTDQYEPGTAYGHVALGVADLFVCCALLENKGVKVLRPPGPMKHDSSEVIAFIEDPDGYKIELIQTSAQ
jgi:lactoylglutathione lyase